MAVISDYIGTMTFLHCNPRHHSIAIQPRNPDLPRSRDKKMWHARHSNDEMVSFYMVTPSGFEVECGWGGRLVDDATWQVQRHDRGGLWGPAVPIGPAAKAASVMAGR
jgi:hypothetical protein